MTTPNSPTPPTLADLRPGDAMFGPIDGLIPGAFPVGAGQILLANRRARLSWRRWWKVRHCGVVVSAAQPDAPAQDWAKLVQAMPHGAEEIALGPQHWTPDYVYIRPAWIPGVSGSDEQMYETARAARGYIGTPYNFLTYGKLAAGVLRMPATEALLRRWISTRRDMMCSQLVDQCLADAGFHVFNDDRLPQDVVPAELFRQLLSMPGQFLIPGQGWRDNADAGF